jgi:monoamine oxidase
VPDPAIRELLASRVQSGHAHPIDDLKADHLGDVSSYLASAETRRLRGGNARLAERLAKDADVRLRTPAVAIEQDERGVRVSVEGGAVEADAAVCAIPLTLLRRLALSPPLPDRVAAAVAAVRYGVAAKLAAPLREPAGPDAVMSVERRFWAYTTPLDEVGCRTLGAWAGAAPVVDDLAASSGPERWLDAVEELWPELRIDRGGAAVTTWLDDPWARGVYSVLAHTPDPQARALLARPHGRVAFAGEHTSHDWSGTMEGALRSGERAAEDVLTMLRR